MAHIPIEIIPYFEAAIYLPMLRIVLEKDYKQIEAGQFKLKKPYFHLIETARKNVENDLKKTKAYMRSHQLRVIQGTRDELFTEYYFYHHQTMEVRRYSNIRLRNQVEVLLQNYLYQSTKENRENTFKHQ